MEPAYYPIPGTLTTTISNRYETVSSSQQVNGKYMVLYVTNGNVPGAPPRFKRPNPFSFRKAYIDYGHFGYRSKTAYAGRYAYTTVTGPATIAGIGSSSPIVDTPDFGRTRDRAMEKIYDQLRGNSNLVVDWAERIQTLRMLKDTLNFRTLAGTFFKNVVKTPAYKRMPKGPDGYQRRLDYATSKWLEYRYGWSPLIYSIYDLADTLDRDLRGGLVYVKGRSGYRTQRTLTTGGSGSTGNPYIGFEGQLKVRTEYGLYFRIPPGVQIQDWTSLNPLGIAWELTPLSFVADWFVNVSQCLSLWENLVLFNKHFEGGYQTDSFLETTNWFQYGYGFQPFIFNPINGDVLSGEESSINGSSVRRIAFKDRQIIINLPIPAGLRLNVKLNAKRMLDASALIHQLFAKRIRNL